MKTSFKPSSMVALAAMIALPALACNGSTDPEPQQTIAEVAVASSSPRSSPTTSWRAE